MTNYHPNSKWSDERRARAIKLYTDGYSASQVAAMIGGVSRNAVIGVVSRAGAQRSAEAGQIAARINRGHALKAGRPPKAPEVARAPNQNAGLNFGTRKLSAPPVAKAGPNPLGRKAGAPAAVKVSADVSRVYQMKPDLALPPEPPAPAVVVPLEALHSHSCRWPIGDPSDPHFGFCGMLKQAGSSYCPDHHRISRVAFRATQPKDGAQLARSLRRWAA